MGVSKLEGITLTCDVCYRRESAPASVVLPGNWLWVGVNKQEVFADGGPEPSWYLTCSVTCRCRAVDSGVLGSYKTPIEGRLMA